MLPDAKYNEDKPLLNDAAFMAWIADLERIMCEFGDKNDGHPYGGPLVESTGLKSWHDGYFVEGYTPQYAFAEDRSYWE